MNKIAAKVRTIRSYSSYRDFAGVSRWLGQTVVGLSMGHVEYARERPGVKLRFVVYGVVRRNFGRGITETSVEIQR